MSSYEANLATCRRCPFKQQGCDMETCACTADGLSIAEHAASGQCPQNLFPPPADSKLVRGAIGVARAVTGTGGADPQLVQDRWNICSRCPQNQLSLGLVYKCNLCGCFTWAKVRNRDEKCPAGKW
jgi:hypothetical protein